MTTSLTFSLIRIAWIMWTLFWIWAARGTKRTDSRESSKSRASYLALMLCGIVVMFLGRFGPQLVPESESLNVLAVALTWIGVFFSIWARVLLGRNWSASVTLKTNHELITTGPYGLVRNPIYSGLLLSGAGMVVALGSLDAFLGYWIVFGSLVWKSLIEERMLTSHFGAAYNEYRRKTKMLIPYVF